MTGLGLVTLLSVAVQGADSLLSRAESLLDRGALREARGVIESVLRHEPDDPQALSLLGRVHLAWPIVGRFEAWRLFEEAAQHAPADPEPRYGQLKVGMFLGDVDGERLARDAMFRILEMTPTYRDIWTQWDRLYVSNGHRRRAAALLARFGDGGITALRRALLLIQAEDYHEADSLLAWLADRGTTNASLLALRAQAAFETGDPAAGARYYNHAVARADADPLEILWRQIAALASPEEEARYHAASPAERADFFRGFWASREPDLTTSTNERVAEHFLRLRTARKEFRLLFPQSRFHRSVLWRTLQSRMAPEVLAGLGDFYLTDVIPGRSVFQDEIQEAGLGVDVRDLPEPDSITRYARYGLDGRGLLYLRFGEPHERYFTVGQNVSVEAWKYDVDGTTVSVTFARATNDGGGDFVLFPTNRAELHNTAIMLERDDTGLEAELPLAVWIAVFRAADAAAAAARLMDVYVRTGTDSAGTALWAPNGLERGRAAGAVPLRMTVPPGPYGFGADGRRDGRLGRIRGDVEIPDLSPGWLALSSLIVGIAPDSQPDRERMLRAMPADLVIERDGRPLTLYTEVYDLPAVNGVSRYDVEYAFTPQDDDARAVAFQFRRAVTAQPTVVERLVIQPGQIPPGTYRITVTVNDRTMGLEAQTVRVDITLH